MSPLDYDTFREVRLSKYHDYFTSQIIKSEFGPSYNYYVSSSLRLFGYFGSGFHRADKHYNNSGREYIYKETYRFNKNYLSSPRTGLLEKCTDPTYMTWETLFQW